MLQAFHHVKNTLDHRTGNVICKTCNVVMEMYQFENHSKEVSHSIFEDISDDQINCIHCNMKMSLEQWDDHQKHDQFDYEYLDGFRECSSCYSVLNINDISKHYDEHFNINSKIHHFQQHTLNKTKSQWIQSLNKNIDDIVCLPPPIPIKKFSSSSSFDLNDNDDPIVHISSYSGGSQDVYTSRLYFAWDTSMNIGNNSSLLLSELKGAKLPSQSKPLTDSDQKCVICGDPVELWQVNDKTEGCLFAYFDVFVINEKSKDPYLCHKKCVIPSNSLDNCVNVEYPIIAD